MYLTGQDLNDVMPASRNVGRMEGRRARYLLAFANQDPSNVGSLCGPDAIGGFGGSLYKAGNDQTGQRTFTGRFGAANGLVGLPRSKIGGRHRARQDRQTVPRGRMWLRQNARTEPHRGTASFKAVRYTEVTPKASSNRVDTETERRP